jgi:hypothetical protein
MNHSHSFGVTACKENLASAKPREAGDSLSCTYAGPRKFSALAQLKLPYPPNSAFHFMYLPRAPVFRWPHPLSVIRLKPSLDFYDYSPVSPIWNQVQSSDLLFSPG